MHVGDVVVLRERRADDPRDVNGDAHGIEFVARFQPTTLRKLLTEKCRITAFLPLRIIAFDDFDLGGEFFQQPFGTPRKVITSRLAPQLLTTILMGMTSRTLGISRISSA